MSKNNITKAVKNCIRNCLGIKKDENVLIITDPPRRQIAELMREEVVQIGGHVDLIMLPEPIKRTDNPLNSPSQMLISAIAASDAVVSFFEDIHSELRPFRITIIETAIKTSRIAHMIGVKAESFEEGGLLADCTKVAEYSNLLATILSKANSLVIKSGTNLEYTLSFKDLGGWHEIGSSDSGILTERGNFGNLPAGEAFMSPSLSRSLYINGEVCIDTYIDQVGFIDSMDPIILSFTRGELTDIRGKAADKLENLLKEAEDLARKRNWEPEYVRKLAEIGIGTNPNSAIGLSTTEIEKGKGSIHIALGDNAFLGGQYKAPNHFDCVIKSVTLLIDDKVVLEKGSLKSMRVLRKEFEENYNLIDDAEIDSDLIVLKTSEKMTIENGKLFKIWRDIEGRCHKTQLGDSETSKRAALLWNQLNSSQTIKELIEINNHDEKSIYQLLHLLDKYLLISIEEKTVIQNVENLRKQEGKKLYELEQYIKGLPKSVDNVSEQDSVYLDEILENIEVIKASLARKNIDVVLERIKQNDSIINAMIHSSSQILSYPLKLSSVIRSFLDITGKATLKVLLSKIQTKYQAIEKELSKGLVFISYSHKDKKWLEKFKTTIKPLIRKGTITVWEDTKILPGSEWKKEIRAALETAKVAVLLVSPTSLASEYIFKAELPVILRAAESGEIAFLWVAISHSLYKETPLNKYQAANDPEKPLDSLSVPEQNKSLVKICEKIIEAMD